MIFPSTYRGAEENEIRSKVDTDDYECDEDVLRFME